MLFSKWFLSTQFGDQPTISINLVIVFAIVVLALVLFVTERFRVDVTAITIMVLLIVLGRWTQISLEQGLSGFSSPATLTVLAMFILSAGVTKTGIVQLFGRRLSEFAGSNKLKQLLVTIDLSNNDGDDFQTPFVEFAPERPSDSVDLGEVYAGYELRAHATGGTGYLDQGTSVALYSE